MVYCLGSRIQNKFSATNGFKIVSFFPYSIYLLLMIVVFSHFDMTAECMQAATML